MLDRLLAALNLLQSEESRVPVTILTGPAGSGKSAVLNYLLHQQSAVKIGVLLNHATGAEAQILEEEHHIRANGGALVVLSGGCICCTQLPALKKEIQKMVVQRGISQLFIEASEEAVPQQLAKALLVEGEHDELPLVKFVSLQELLAVVTAKQLLAAAGAVKEPPLRNTAALKLAQQLGQAQSVAISHIAELPEQHKPEVLQLVRACNPAARLYSSRYGKLEPLTEQPLPAARVEQLPDWLEQRYQSNARQLQAQGLQLVSFTDRRPFHPERFMALLNQLPTLKLLRAEGKFWLASRPAEAWVLQCFGQQLHYRMATQWWASMPESERVKSDYYVLNKRYFRTRWDAHFGDRLNELAFVIKGRNEAQWLADLDDCLCTPAELKASQHTTFNDPFPQVELSKPASAPRFRYLEHYFGIG